jgi:argininosuccinate lyase
VYRSRPKGGLEDDASRFLSSMSQDEEILYYDILCSEAHSLMLYEIGILNQSELKKILIALEEIKTNNKLVFSSEKYHSIEKFEDIHEYLESYVIKYAGIEAGGKMQTARSRNDQIMVDIHMKVRDQINNSCTAILDLIASLLSKAKDHKYTTMIMYTHLQQAQIGTFSHFLISYVEALFRDIDRLYLTYRRINQSPLGACAIGGSCINIDRKRTATLLGFNSVIENSIYATSSRDVIIEFVFSIVLVMTTLSRIAEDLIIWSTSEFCYIDIADEYSSTSSAMPQKKNPDPLELIRSKASLLLGNLLAMISTIKALPSGYSRDLQDLKIPLWQSCDTALQSIGVMNNIIKSLNVCKERMEEAASASYAVSIDIAEQLVLRKRIPFRSAHQLVGALVQKAIANANLPLAMLKEKDIKTVVQRTGYDLEIHELMQIIRETTPAKSVRMRASVGSPNPVKEEHMIRSSYTKAAAYREVINKRKKSVTAAFDNLLMTVQGHLNHKK